MRIPLWLNPVQYVAATRQVVQSESPPDEVESLEPEQPVIVVIIRNISMLCDLTRETLIRESNIFMIDKTGCWFVDTDQ